MPRPNQPAASTLRNRNRITNKTRLRIHRGNIDADPIIPDEDEEKNRFLQSVAGVDQEDANEHHLQQVLSEAAVRPQATARKAAAAAAPPPAAYIPTPDSTGTVDNYEELYPPNRWKDPHSYIYSSYTVEETCKDGLADGWNYFMDERDQEWLEKNNEEARGEGTSAQGAVSRTSSRANAANKAKGKEPETPQSVPISEDEFELTMGLFEKFTHEKTEFLAHGLETGMTFPPFSDYQDAFSNPLPLSNFATYVAPSWLPQPTHLSRIAKLIYPHWKERRLERSGHRIIPTLNGDEADTLNESYVCFRRRELKAVRKTRASQASSSDKLMRLQSELEYPMQLAKKILERETLKRECNTASQYVWERRAAISDLKRRNPSAFGGEAQNKADEELLIDKERVVRKSEVRANGLKIPAKGDSRGTGPQAVEATMRPKERLGRIQHETDQLLARQKEKDRDWEDYADFAYQAPYAPFPTRAFKNIPSSSSSDTSSSTSSSSSRDGRSVRLRLGRGGRQHIDRRPPPAMDILPRRKRPWLDDGEGDEMDVDDKNSDDEEAERRLRERWRFDSDEAASTQAEEQDRVLVDEFDIKYLRHTIRILVSDQDMLTTDPTIHRFTAEGKREGVIGFRLGLSNALMSRPPALPPPPQTPQQQQRLMPNLTMPVNGGTPPISMMKQQQHLRISRGGGAAPGGMSPPQGSPPHPQHSPPNGMRGAMTVPHVTENGVNGDAAHPPPPQAVPSQDPATSIPAAALPPTVNGQSFIQRPKILSSSPHPPQAPVTNGYYPATSASSQSQPQNTSVLSTQQMQNLKSVFASGQDLSAIQARYNFNLKLPPGGVRYPVQGSPVPVQVPGRVLSVPQQQQPQQHSPPLLQQSPQQGTAGTGAQGGY